MLLLGVRKTAPDISTSVPEGAVATASDASARLEPSSTKAAAPRT